MLGNPGNEIFSHMGTEETYANNKKARRLHSELCAEIESVDLVGDIFCVDLPSRCDLDPYKLDLGR